MEFGDWSGKGNGRKMGNKMREKKPHDEKEPKLSTDCSVMHGIAG